MVQVRSSRVAAVLLAASVAVGATGTALVVRDQGAADVLTTQTSSTPPTTSSRDDVERSGDEPRPAAAAGGTSPSPTDPAPGPAAAAPAPAQAAPAAAAPAEEPPAAAAPTAPRPAAPTRARPGGSSTGGADYGPTGPETTRFPFTPGRTEYTVVHDGVTLTARFSRMRARTGEPIDIEVVARANHGECCGVTLQYGDGQRWGEGTTQSCPSHTTTTSRRVAQSHAWNKAQRWQLLLHAAGGGCNGPGGNAGMLVTVEIAPGTTVSNGPSKPVVHLDQGMSSHPNDRTYMAYYGHARDEDGWISHFELDRGDGSPVQTFRGDPNGCREGPGGQPAGSEAWLPQNPPHEHRYAPGTYTVTLRAYSQGCDGKNVQVSTTSIVYATQ